MDVDLAPESVEVLENILLDNLKRSANLSDEVWQEMQSLLYALHNSNTVHISKKSSF